MKYRRSKRNRATDISKQVKEAVWKRDNGRCVVCGNSCNVMPNAHYIRRSKGGLGVERNIVTLCTRLTPNDCHHKFDEGTLEEQEYYKEKIRNYLMSKYPDWNEEELIYSKYKKWEAKNENRDD